MKTRLLISSLVVAAVAYACGPRSRSSDASVATLARAPLMKATAFSMRSAERGAEAAMRRHDVITKRGTLDSQLDVNVGPATVRLKFNVRNAGAKHVELNFRNGQVYDFLVVDSAGREVWRWGSGRLFTQAVRNKQLSKGESLRAEARWSHAVTPGRYMAIATLTSSNYPLEQRVEFVVPPEVNVAAR